MTLARFACAIPFALLISACTPNTTSAPASEPGAPAPLSAEGDFGATLQGALINAKPSAAPGAFKQTEKLKSLETWFCIG
jgi:hypothetical protein